MYASLVHSLFLISSTKRFKELLIKGGFKQAENGIAKNKEEAAELAIEELQMDTTVSSAWVENSKVTDVNLEDKW